MDIFLAVAVKHDCWKLLLDSHHAAEQFSFLNLDNFFCRNGKRFVREVRDPKCPDFRNWIWLVPYWGASHTRSSSRSGGYREEQEEQKTRTDSHINILASGANWPHYVNWSHYGASSEVNYYIREGRAITDSSQAVKSWQKSCWSHSRS